MKKVLFLVACASAALLTTGCKLFWQAANDTASALSYTPSAPRNENDPVLLKIDGKPMLYKTEFLEFVEQALKANPYLASFGITSYESAPEQIRQQLLDAVVQQKLITCWGDAQGIEKSAQYQESFAKVVDQLRQALVAQSFDKQIFETVSVTDEEIMAEFDRSRDQMIKEPGSVKAVGVSFADEEKANVFYDLVAKKEEDSFVNLAKESKVTPVEFGSIALDPRTPAPAGVPAAVKRALLGLADSQYYVQAQEGDAYWVVQVTDKVKPTYLSFDEVKDQVAAAVRHEKFKTVRDARINELRSKHTVDIDSSSLGSGQDPLALLQQMLAAQGQANPEFLEELENELGAPEGSETEEKEDDERPVTVSL